MNANSVNRDRVLPFLLVTRWHVSQCLQVKNLFVNTIYDSFTIYSVTTAFLLAVQHTIGEYSSIMPFKSASFHNHIMQLSKCLSCLLSLRFIRENPGNVYIQNSHAYQRRQNFIGQNRVFHDMTSRLYEYKMSAPNALTNQNGPNTSRGTALNKAYPPIGSNGRSQNEWNEFIQKIVWQSQIPTKNVKNLTKQ